MPAKLVEKPNNLASVSAKYPLRSQNDAKIFIPNVSKLNGNKKIPKRKLIKKQPKIKSLKEKKIVKKQVGVKAISSEIKKEKIRKIRALVIRRSKNSSKETKRTLTGSKRKNEKPLQNSKKDSSLKKPRISQRLKKYKKVQELIGDTIIQSKRLRSKNLNGRNSLSPRGTSLKKINKQQTRKSKADKANLKNADKLQQKQKTSLNKQRKKSKSKSKRSDIAPNIKVLPPKRLRKNLNAISPINIQLRSQDESVLSKASEASKSKQAQTRFKTIAELQRRNRSRQQRIFLLNAVRVQNKEWTFKVIGTIGKIYETKISTNVVCSCLDFRSKRKPCKHIYFIVTQIAQNQKILEGFTSQATISEAAYNQINQNLYRRLKARIQGDKAEVEMRSQVDLKDDKDCVICFTEMSQSGQILQDCKTCKKYFHDACIKKWKTHNNSCPLCRSEFPASKQQNDPLQKFQELKI